VATKVYKPVVTGLLADPKAAEGLRDAIVAGLDAEGKRLVALVKSVTPVGKTGDLREAIRHKVMASRKGVTLRIDGDRATREGGDGDSTRSKDRVAGLVERDRKRAERAARKGLPFVSKLQEQLDRVKGGRRYGKVPYGVFVENKTKFMKGTVNDEEPAILAAGQSAIDEYVKRSNQQLR